jgi:hypothetical protein
MKLAPLSVVAVLLAGCHHVDSDDRPTADTSMMIPTAAAADPVNSELPAWVGHKASELIAAWGKPTTAADATPGSYQGRAGIDLTYHIGDQGSVVNIPETSSYTDSLGVTHTYDSSTISVPHFVIISFAVDKSGVIIDAHWWGTFADRFTADRYPCPTASVTLPFPLIVAIAPSSHGGAWEEPTADEAAAEAQKTTPDNVAAKLSEMENK